jgi:hypothetical protein
MTKDQAIETCTRAMLRRRNYREENWKEHPDQKALAADVV